MGPICQSFCSFYKTVYTITFPFDDNLHRAMDQSVHRRAAHKGIGKYHDPFVEVTVAGDNRRGTLVALTDHLVEIRLLLLAHGFQTEIVEDQQGDPCDRFQAPFMGPIASARVDPLKQ